jgi:hypothetical protein
MILVINLRPPSIRISKIFCHKDGITFIFLAVSTKETIKTSVMKSIQKKELLTGNEPI